MRFFSFCVQQHVCALGFQFVRSVVKCNTKFVCTFGEIRKMPTELEYFHDGNAEKQQHLLFCMEIKYSKCKYMQR